MVLGMMQMTSCTEQSVSQNFQPINLTIEYDRDIPIDEKVSMTLHENKDEMSKVLSGRIKRRGGYSIIYDKHSYEIDLESDHSIAGLAADDDWVLNANYIDKTFMRHVLSYELFREMDSNNCASHTHYVEVNLNGKYNGLYVLMEKVDRSVLGVDKSDSAAFIFKEPHLFRSNYDDVVPQDPENFHQQTFPKIEVEDKNELVEEWRSLILNSNDNEFTTEIEVLFDLQNLIDWHLLLLISNNSDGILKNFYLYKKDAFTKLRIAPWDYDHSFGRDGDNELNLDTRPLDINRSILFSRLLTFEWYTSLLKSRWLELNENNLLSNGGLKNRINKKKENLKSIVDKNFELWPLDAEHYYDENNFEEEVNIMFEFIDLRHQRLSDYFEQL